MKANILPDLMYKCLSVEVLRAFEKLGFGNAQQFCHLIVGRMQARKMYFISKLQRAHPGSSVQDYAASYWRIMRGSTSARSVGVLQLRQPILVTSAQAMSSTAGQLALKTAATASGLQSRQLFAAPPVLPVEVIDLEASAPASPTPEQQRVKDTLPSSRQQERAKSPEEGDDTADLASNRRRQTVIDLSSIDLRSLSITKLTSAVQKQLLQGMRSSKDEDSLISFAIPHFINQYPGALSCQYRIPPAPELAEGFKQFLLFACGGLSAADKKFIEDCTSLYAQSCLIGGRKKHKKTFNEAHGIEADEDFEDQLRAKQPAADEDAVARDDQTIETDLPVESDQPGQDINEEVEPPPAQPQPTSETAPKKSTTSKSARKGTKRNASKANIDDDDPVAPNKKAKNAHTTSAATASHSVRPSKAAEATVAEEDDNDDTGNPSARADRPIFAVHEAPFLIDEDGLPSPDHQSPVAAATGADDEDQDYEDESEEDRSAVDDDKEDEDYEDEPTRSSQPRYTIVPNKAPQRQKETTAAQQKKSTTIADGPEQSYTRLTRAQIAAQNFMAQAIPTQNNSEVPEELQKGPPRYIRMAELVGQHFFRTEYDQRYHAVLTQNCFGQSRLYLCLIHDMLSADYRGNSPREKWTDVMEGLYRNNFRLMTQVPLDFDENNAWEDLRSEQLLLFVDQILDDKPLRIGADTEQLKAVAREALQLQIHEHVRIAHEFALAVDDIAFDIPYNMIDIFKPDYSGRTEDGEEILERLRAQYGDGKALRQSHDIPPLVHMLKYQMGHVQERLHAESQASSEGV